MNWQLIAEYALTISCFSALLAWLVRQAVMFVATSGIEKYKSDLNKELEKYKNELQEELELRRVDFERLKNENSVVFERLHSDRVGVVKKIHSMIVDLERCLKITLSRKEISLPPPTMNEVSVIAEKVSELDLYFSKNVLFFCEGTCELIRGIIRDLTKIYTDIVIYAAAAALPEKEYEDLAAKEEKLRAGLFEIDNEIRKAKHMLEGSFRKLLGV